MKKTLDPTRELMARGTALLLKSANLNIKVKEFLRESKTVAGKKLLNDLAEIETDGIKLLNPLIGYVFSVSKKK